MTYILASERNGAISVWSWDLRHWTLKHVQGDEGKMMRSSIFLVMLNLFQHPESAKATL